MKTRFIPMIFQINMYFFTSRWNEIFCDIAKVISESGSGCIFTGFGSLVAKITVSSPGKLRDTYSFEPKVNIFLDHSITLNVVCRLWKSSVNTAPSFKMSGSHLFGAFWRKPLVTAINYRYLKWEITHKSQYIQHELFQLMIQRTRSASAS